MAVAPLGRIAVIVLALLRHDRRAADLADGDRIAQSTVRRRRDEVSRLPAAKAPRLDRALNRLVARGGQAVLIDGTLIPTWRHTGAANRPHHSGKHRRHGLALLALTDERGRLIWISAARHDHVLAHLRAARLGFLGLDDDPENPVVVTRYKATGKHEITRGQKSANTVLPGAQALVEHGFA